MRIAANKTTCEGHSQCMLAAPEVFGLSDELVVSVLDEQPDEDRRAAVLEAIRVCPTQSLSLAQA
jgi:ferredoxin